MSAPYDPSMNPLYPGDLDYQTQQPPAKHSGLGIAATIIGVVAGLLEVITFGAAVVVGSRGGSSPNDPVLMTIGFSVCGGLALALVGAILGLVGLFVGRRKRLLAIIGLVINMITLLGMGGVVIIGIAIK